MRVLVTGAKWHDNSPAIVADGFRAAGHEAEIFYDNAAHWSQKGARVFSRIAMRRGAAWCDETYRRRVAAAFEAKVADYAPDFVFTIAGFRLPGDVVRAVRKRHGIPAANFVVDDPAFCSRTLLHDLGAYSAVFCIDKSWMPVIGQFNPGNVHYLPHAGDALHFKRLGTPKDVDISFGGTMSLRMPNGPAGYLRATVLSALAEAGFKITAFAGGVTETFAEFPALRNIEYYDGYKNHDELNALYNRSKIVLSVHSPQLKAGVSPRIFDAALSGSFQLVENKPDMPELFPEGIACFDSPQEAVALARKYLSEENERERFASIAYDTAVNRHTFKSRVREICRVMKLQ